MSECFDELLDIPGEDVNEDFEIGDDEEEALLDENYDITNKSHVTINEKENDMEHEQDFVLDLDDTIGLNEEETDLLDSTCENDEECVRQDRFTSERPVIAQGNDKPASKKKLSPSNWKQPNYFRGGYRGRKMNRGTGRFYQNLNRSYPPKNVLINPHFKGRVPIRNNVSLVWDKTFDNRKKPELHVQPWAHQTSFMTQQNSGPFQQPQEQFYNNDYIGRSQINTGVPVLQRLSINTKFLPPPMVNQQFLHQGNPTYQSYPQQSFLPQCNGNFVVNPYLQQQQIRPHPSPMFNTPPPTVVNPVSYNPMMCQNNQADSSYSHYTPSYSDQSTRTFSNNDLPDHKYHPHIPVQTRQNFENTTTSFSRSIRRNVNPNKMGAQERRRFPTNNDFRNRRAVSSNLQEVKTSDIIVKEESKITVTLDKIIEEDESTIQYRKQIEEQKKLRERILARKEQRRMQALRQSEEDPITVVAPPREIITEVNNIPKITKVIVNKPSRPVQIISNVARVVKKAIPKKETAIEKKAITSFLSNRKIYAKDDSLPNTSVVVVSNLATGSTEVKLRTLCKGIGDVQNLQMSPNERQATIQFNSVASAHAFYKKYQRFMLDLSMIQVTLK